MVLLTASTNDSPVHVLMLSFQVVDGLLRTLVPGVVPLTNSYPQTISWFLYAVAIEPEFY